VQQLQEDVAERIAATGAKGVIIDITAVEIVDSFIGRMLSMIGSMSRLFDAQTVLVGMRPAVAITLVELGLTLDGVQTALNTEKGRATGRGPSPAWSTRSFSGTTRASSPPCASSSWTWPAASWRSSTAATSRRC
jgi:rsbT antagonist protein RsbS